MAKILQGDALTELTFLESESIDCCITSPPYWALRDYKVDGQLGLEPTFQEYVTKLVNIFDEVKRVLVKTGSCWVVIGDTYNTRTITNKDGPEWGELQRANKPTSTYFHKQSLKTMQHKSLCMIPERFSIAMIDHGWILRNKIIWYKPNCMPSSAKDRFTVDWEYVYFFTKSQKYFFETQYEPMSDLPVTVERRKQPQMLSTKDKEYMRLGVRHGFCKAWDPNYIPNPLGRIKRCVWKISTKPFSSGAHFAVFPPDLVEPMIKAGCPEYICNKCGIPRKLEYEEIKVRDPRPALTDKYKDMKYTASARRDVTNRDVTVRMPKFGGNRAAEYGPRQYSGKEWNPSIKQEDGMTDCGCNTGFHSGIVLDPFFGAGTVGLVALQNGRDFVGIELNPDYIEIANKRLDPLLNQQKLR